MGHIISSLQAVISIGFGMVVAFVTTTATVWSVFLAQSPDSVRSDEEGGAATVPEALLHVTQTVFPVLPQTIHLPASSAASACASETLQANPLAVMEVDENAMVPAADLLLGIGSSFTAEPEEVQYPSHIIEKLHECSAPTQIWPTSSVN